MINQNLLSGCIKEVLALADVLDTSYARKNGCELIVSRGFSTPEHNAAVGGSPKSLHLKGAALDCFFSDKYNIFKHVSSLYELVVKQEGVFKGVTQMEVCRGIINGKWCNHLHFGFGQEPETIYFSGVYRA